ncbi:DUF4288 domain-containing protein [Dyella nitratireducens]|uniref:DUF4288 domain-containing protein n=1 Tax=Dyella nitratireducens TaxID=1849580 RepID=A0ABQ1FU10_9GAMM|nr:DUF4288 domain-containing protein [Dyella nitratireducens]GGA29511.1 hypothetical protein GCM10010981_18060 [Dyella nitratireducens]GLQ43129.1 hypothetical protein GCM10007902_29790 [Dyella nitratireducens]
MAWYGIRTIYQWGEKSDGTSIFEERIVVFEATSSDEAHAKASTEAKAYSGGTAWIAYPEQVGYEQDGKPLVDAYEVWSELFEGSCSLDEFYAQRYSRFLYHPE